LILLQGMKQILRVTPWLEHGENVTDQGRKKSLGQSGTNQKCSLQPRNL
jgi:hypothetical protein